MEPQKHQDPVIWDFGQAQIALCVTADTLKDMIAKGELRLAGAHGKQYRSEILTFFADDVVKMKR